MPELDVRISAAGPMTAFFNRLDSALANVEGPMKFAFQQASERYLGFTRRRYVTLSKGGGEWPDLALSTKIARMRKTEGGGLKAGYAKKQKVLQKWEKNAGTNKKITQAALAVTLHFDILRDTGLGLNSLSTGAPGFQEESIPGGIRIGSAVKYLRFHQAPTKFGRPPQRTIFVPPDGPTKKAMGVCLAEGMNQLIRHISTNHD